MGTAARGDLALAAPPAPPPPAARASPSAAASWLAPGLSERGAPRRSRGPTRALGLSERRLYDPRVENTSPGDELGLRGAGAAWASRPRSRPVREAALRLGEDEIEVSDAPAGGLDGRTGRE